MDLAEALRIVNTEVELTGRSDDLLINQIQNVKDFKTPDKVISPAAGLENGVILRPVEALHKLSFATRSWYQDDLFDRYLQWALMRYIGFFELGPYGGRRQLLRVSAGGRRIVGNQRRVTSEELGIAFAALLADRWIQHSAGRQMTINPVDVDVALSNRHVFAGGSKIEVRAAGTRRPDYLLLASAPSAPLRFYVRVLECKGTRNRSTAVRQMAKAVGQLGGITVNGRIPPGLAVATITANDQITYLALDPDGDDESYEPDPEVLREAGRFELDEGTRNAPARMLVSAALRSSWATLADYGGNLAAVDRWAPEVMRRRLDRRPRPRQRWDTPYGAAVGTSATFTFDDQALTVRYGIAASLDERLSGSGIESIVETQAEFTRTLAQDHSASRYAASANLREVHSASPEGSIFSLRLT